MSPNCADVHTSDNSLHHITSHASDQPVGMHIMPSISFATGGGNPEDAQVIGYVAKDELNARNVYVFDCGGQAEDIIATMGQGFELRYKARLFSFFCFLFLFFIFVFDFLKKISPFFLFLFSNLHLLTWPPHFFF